MVVKDGFIEVRLGAQEQSTGWESNLEVTPKLELATRVGDPWVERWDLEASPVWNVKLSGLAPIFEPRNPVLVPVWQPWPGEVVELAVSRPEAIAGATVTVNRGVHEISLGARQRVSKLTLSLRCSLGEDFLIDLPADAEITSLALNAREIPVRKDGSRVIIPLRPGDQTVTMMWKINRDLGVRVQVEEVRLPIESANVSTIISIPQNRLTLWANGPQMGPAVRFWGIVWFCSFIAGGGAGPDRANDAAARSNGCSLIIGLTQVPLVAALLVIGWLFFLAWRGQESFQHLKPREHNVLQVLLAGLTAIALGIIVVAVREGLLGTPEMFITGNGSSQTILRWFLGALRRAPAATVATLDFDLVVSILHVGVGALAGRCLDPLAARRLGTISAAAAFSGNRLHNPSPSRRRHPRFRRSRDRVLKLRQQIRHFFIRRLRKIFVPLTDAEEIFGHHDGCHLIRHHAHRFVGSPRNRGRADH